ncbi:HAD-like domain-containing protein [Dunaliella salina]|uniref:phosphoserine phosphatase n=1 Tax=Dunaliella salina TaxID=3046 RepID=A0ABQ7G213_DUNSA|nr:HAD-like domain-containing protein [Dunaliella salina]|eukprot:KAF5828643.1 HAD-like domain-containing protein [Dunaliella salina]
MPNTNPSDHALSTWRTADCVCLDVDCTVTQGDGLDLLAMSMGCYDKISGLSDQAQDGSMNLSHTLEERLRIINCTPDDLRRFVETHPPESRMTKGIVNLIKVLQKRGVAVYLISGSFRELILPLAKYLGVPKENVYANRMAWQWDDDTGQPTRLMGFDPSQPTSSNGGKIRAISKIREDNPYNTVVLIGDGITDLEAVRSSEGADLFIGYGGVVERSTVAEAAEWFVYDHDDLTRALKQSRVAMVGSSALACAMVPMLCHNVLQDEQFDNTVMMWVHDAAHTHEFNRGHSCPLVSRNTGLVGNFSLNFHTHKICQGAQHLAWRTSHQLDGGECHVTVIYTSRLDTRDAMSWLVLFAT